MPKEENIEGEVKSGVMKKVLLAVLAVIILLGIGAGSTYYLAKTKPGMIGLPKNTAEQQAEVDAIIAQVGKLITLPAGETPTIATITDVAKLKDQPFFKNAQNGDRLLVYQNANKAIIFRPSENRIIDVGAVNVTAPSATPEGNANPTGKTPKPTATTEATPNSTVSP